MSLNWVEIQGIKYMIHSGPYTLMECIERVQQYRCNEFRNNQTDVKPFFYEGGWMVVLKIINAIPFTLSEIKDS